MQMLCRHISLCMKHMHETQHAAPDEKIIPQASPPSLHLFEATHRLLTIIQELVFPKKTCASFLFLHLYHAPSLTYTSYTCSPIAVWSQNRHFHLPFLIPNTCVNAPPLKLFQAPLVIPAAVPTVRVDSLNPITLPRLFPSMNPIYRQLSLPLLKTLCSPNFLALFIYILSDNKIRPFCSF